jgi:RNA polymerase sigma-70 factor
VGMTNKPRSGCTQYFLQAYENAKSEHRHLGLGFDDYVNCLLPIITKHLGENPQPVTVIGFVAELHTNDLYLTIACAHKSEAAWQQFDLYFRKYLLDLAKRESANVEAARELANGVFTDLFFEDRSGRPRIASYEGQCSLARWLRIVISNRAINERQRKCNDVESLESTTDFIDENSLHRIELPLRAKQYRPIVQKTFQGASCRLTEREQYILLLRYDHKLKEQVMGRLLGVHQSTVTRLLQRIYQKMRREVMMILADRYQLPPEAIEECVVDMLENPEYSLLESIKDCQENLSPESLDESEAVI